MVSDHWSLMFRIESELPTNNVNCSNYCEVSFRITKDLKFGRNRAYNLVELVEIECDDSSYYTQRCQQHSHKQTEKSKIKILEQNCSHWSQANNQRRGWFIQCAVWDKRGRNILGQYGSKGLQLPSREIEGTLQTSENCFNKPKHPFFWHHSWQQSRNASNLDENWKWERNPNQLFPPLSNPNGPSSEDTCLDLNRKTAKD